MFKAVPATVEGFLGIMSESRFNTYNKLILIGTEAATEFFVR